MTSFPTIRDFFEVLFRRPQLDVCIKGLYAKDSADEAHLFSTSTWSLVAISEWLSTCINRQPVFWFPDYFCSEVTRALEKHGAVVEFYETDCNRQPAESWCLQKLDSRKPDVIVVVHFFGKVADMSWVQSFCSENDVILIEDAAHSIASTAGIGLHGDFVLYSPHKQLPLPDGAVCIVRSQGPKALSNEDLASFSSITLAIHSRHAHSTSHTLRWCMTRFAQAIGLRLIRKCSYEEVMTGRSDNMLSHASISRAGVAFLYNGLRQLSDVEQTRYENAELLEVLCSIHPVSCESVINYANAPYLVELRFSSDKQAKRAFETFQSEGLPVSIWPEIDASVSNSRNCYEEAQNSWKTSIFLSPHQSLDRRVIIRHIANAIEESSRDWVLEAVSPEEYRENFATIDNTNWLQAIEYGEAKSVETGWDNQTFALKDRLGQAKAIFSSYYKSIPLVGRLVRINRGPVWSSSSEDNNLQLKLISAICGSVRKNNWLAVQWAPPFKGTNVERLLLEHYGFRKLKNEAWGSSVIYLDEDTESIMNSFKPKWRNTLKKAIKSGVTICSETLSSCHRPLLQKLEEEVKVERGYIGIDLDFLFSINPSNINLQLFLAMDEDKKRLLGAVIVCKSGRVAEYLFGITNSHGRSLQCNSLLLWESLLWAHRNGCQRFDLGGLNAATPRGIARFKRGLNGVEYAEAGDWRKINFLSVTNARASFR